MTRPAPRPEDLQRSLEQVLATQLAHEMLLVAFARRVLPPEKYEAVANTLSVACHAAVDGLKVQTTDGQVQPGFAFADNPSFRALEEGIRTAVDRVCSLIAAPLSHDREGQPR